VNSRRLVAIPAAALVLAAAAAAAQHDAAVNVTAKNYSFSLSTKSAATGTVTYSVRNSGKHDHNFQINGKKTAAIKPGKSAKLTVWFTKPGPFTYQSTLNADAKKGMKGTFTAKANGDVANGKKVFVSTGCGACHRMKAAGTTGTLGPNLDKSKLSRTATENVITAGKNAMPPYRKTLTAKQIDDVSEFVFQKRTGLGSR
jgi:mono/diheme cytochrome c family protein